MITVLVTCWLLAGATFLPVDGWQIEKVIGGGVPEFSGQMHLVYCGAKGCPEPDRRTQVYLRRTLQPGQTVNAPPGCSVSLEAP